MVGVRLVIVSRFPASVRSTDNQVCPKFKKMGNRWFLYWLRADPRYGAVRHLVSKEEKPCNYISQVNLAIWELSQDPT